MRPPGEIRGKGSEANNNTILMPFAVGFFSERGRRCGEGTGGTLRMLTLTLTGCAIKSCGNARTHTHRSSCKYYEREAGKERERERGEAGNGNENGSTFRLQKELKDLLLMYVCVCACLRVSTLVQHLCCLLAPMSSFSISLSVDMFMRAFPSR